MKVFAAVSLIAALAAIAKRHALRKNFARLDLCKVRAVLSGLERVAWELSAGHMVHDQMAAVGEHGLKQLLEHFLFIEGQALLLPLSKVGLRNLGVYVVEIVNPGRRSGEPLLGPEGRPLREVGDHDRRSHGLARDAVSVGRGPPADHPVGAGLARANGNNLESERLHRGGGRAGWCSILREG